MTGATGRRTALPPLDVLGVGAWSSGRRGWAAWVAAVATDGVAAAAEPLLAQPTTVRPLPAVLSPAERRRVPDGVAVAIEAASEAVAAAVAAAPDRLSSGDGRVALPSVFASAHGDLAIVDYLCTTTATDPGSLSPLRFHHSVHNAASGYWSIATGDRSESISIAAGRHTFASGLVEAATQALTRAGPVLFVAFDTPAVGLLRHAVANDALFGCALVLAPAGGASATSLTLATVEIAADADVDATAPRTADGRTLAASSAAALGTALLETLAASAPGQVELPLGPRLSLTIDVAPPSARPAATIG